MVDLDPFSKLKTLSDYQQLEQAFQVQRATALAKLQAAQQGAELPAPLQLANAYQQAIKAGDTDRANQILTFAKAGPDKTVVLNASGSYQLAPGLAPALGELAATKAGMEQQAKDQVRIQTVPVIAAGEANARQVAELNYAAPIAQNKEQGKAAGEATALLNKKGVQANNMLDLIGEAEGLLPQATSGGIDTVVRAGKGLTGTSDEKTKADNRLGVISAGLVANVPRMEGPQSDRDVMMYREAAGDIANTTKPYEDRLSALQTIKTLQQKYATGGEVKLKSAPPDGANLYGTSGGKNVYKLPNGSFVMEQ